LETKDSELIRKCLEGDQKAFEKLLNRYKGSVFSVCYKMVKNRTDAEDLAQEAFVKVFSVLDRYDTSYPFSSWLFRITSNLCIDFLRKKRYKTYSIDEPIEGKEGKIDRQISSHIIQPDRETENSEMMVILEEALDLLPENYRIIVILRHQEHLSYDEISENLGIPLGTVKARIHRARRMIRDIFKERGLV
jgi:RNA polymerase sigma-W factor